MNNYEWQMQWLDKDGQDFINMIKQIVDIISPHLQLVFFFLHKPNFNQTYKKTAEKLNILIWQPKNLNCQHKWIPFLSCAFQIYLNGLIAIISDKCDKIKVCAIRLYNLWICL